MVVISIIGILIGVLLPAVQAAREAARKTQCSNHIKQMMLAMANHESTQGAFPSGGVTSWPLLQNYLSESGTPYGPQYQGLGWAFQILPFLEGGTLYNVQDQAALENTVIPMFNCPSRRPATRWSGVSGVGVSPYLMDYAAAVPFKSDAQLMAKVRPGTPWTNPWYEPGSFNGDETKGCQLYSFWGFISGGGPAHEFEMNFTAEQLKQLEQQGRYVGFHGVIIRSDLCVNCAGGARMITGFYTKISYPQITDGASNTMVLGEKRLQPSLYDIGEWHDDRGWTGGWDPDGLRSTICRIGPDMDHPPTTSGVDAGYRFGSAHVSHMNAGFADASVRQISYEIDLRVLNKLGHRSDGEIVEQNW